MGGAADVAILAAAMSGTVLFGYALIARAGKNRSRLALALQVAQYEAALRGHDDVDEAHLLHALLHDLHATTGVIAPDHLLAWQDASGRFLSSRPADTPAGGTLPASSPELDAVVAAFVSKRAPLPQLLRDVMGLPLVADLVAEARDSPAMTPPPRTDDYRADPRPERPWDVRFWDDPHTKMEGVVQVLENVFGLTPTTAVFHMFETHHFDSSTIGPFTEAEARSLIARARAASPRRVETPWMTAEPRGSQPSSPSAWWNLHRAKRANR